LKHEHAVVRHRVGPEGQRRSVDFHLFGHWRAPDSLVFGARARERSRDDEHALAMRLALATTSTLLFIGCGPDEPIYADRVCVVPVS
jgi:hypothetical protein